MIQVQVIRQDGGVFVVEYNDGTTCYAGVLVPAGYFFGNFHSSKVFLK